MGNTLHQATPPGGAGATPSVVKFTILDSAGMSLSTATTTVGTVKAGDTVNIPYSGATVGADRYVSAVIENANGAVLFYGKLASAATVNNGTASFTVPSAAALPNGNYTIKLFVEEINGDTETDFASAPIAIAMNVNNTPLAGSTTSIPVLTPVGLGLLALALMGLAARRRQGF